MGTPRTGAGAPGTAVDRGTGRPGARASEVDGTARARTWAARPDPPAADGTACSGRRSLSETIVEGLGAGGTGGFVAMVPVSRTDGGLATSADQAATRSGDGSGAPAVTIAGARRSRGGKAYGKRSGRRPGERLPGSG
ncbi:unnamed protein product [Closterium sp. NIES-54]